MMRGLEVTLIDVSDEYEKDTVFTRVFDIYVGAWRKIVGRVEYRFETGIDLEYYGNIGYVVYLPYRGHRYAYKACVEILKIMYREYPEIDAIRITCNPDNEPSKKTIQRLGATYLRTVDVDPSHELHAYGETQKEVYELYRNKEGEA